MSDAGLPSPPAELAQLFRAADAEALSWACSWQDSSDEHHSNVPVLRARDWQGGGTGNRYIVLKKWLASAICCSAIVHLPKRFTARGLNLPLALANCFDFRRARLPTSELSSIIRPQGSSACSPVDFSYSHLPFDSNRTWIGSCPQHPQVNRLARTIARTCA